MTFSRAKPAGFVTGDRLTADQINTIDLNQSRAVDGYAGGTYAPSGAVTINGAGLVVGGSGLSTNGLSLTGNGTQTAGNSFNVLGEIYIGATGSIVVASGGTLGLDARSAATCTAYERTQYIGACSGGHLVGFATITSGVSSFWQQTLAASWSGIHVPLTCVPLAANITEIEVQLMGASGHAGLPQWKPTVALSQQTPTGTKTAIGSTTDTSASVGAYEVMHPITLSGLNLQPINNVYYVDVGGESGTNELIGLIIASIAVTWSTNSVGL